MAFIIELDGLCMITGEAAVTVGVVTEAMAGRVAGDDAMSANFAGIVVILILAPFLSMNYNNTQ